MRWYAVCPVLVRFVRFSLFRHPVGILYVSVDVRLTSVVNGQYRTGNRVSWARTACAFCDRSTNVLSVSYTVHIRFVRYTSATHTLVDRSLSVTCLVPMRSLRLPRRHSPPLRRLPSPCKHFFVFFLSVRRPLPLSVNV